jgi:exodeoxyribonuclease V alpha subunit
MTRSRAEPPEAAGSRLAQALTDTLSRLAPTADRTTLESVLQGIVAANLRGDTRVPLSHFTEHPGDWAERLRECGLAVDHASDTTDGLAPLVLDAHGHVALRRHHEQERRVAQRLASMLQQAPLEPGPGALAYLRQLARTDGDRSRTLDDQTLAVAAACRHRLAVITGGPGTGKTTTLRNLLTTLLADQNDLRTALVAPTGKAAARMAQSLEDVEAVSTLRATTLHRLLGYRPGENRFRHDAAHPLPFDLVICDEASMVDLALMDALLAALPATSRLVLMGDRDQLPSVGCGQVLADLCVLARPQLGPSREVAAFVAGHLGADVGARQDGTESPFASVVTQLFHSYRFDAEQPIGQFASAAANRERERALAAFRADPLALERVDPEAADKALATWLGLLAEQRAAADPSDALRRLGSARILCAGHHGPHGLQRLNADIQLRLARAEGVGADEELRGTPILVTANDHRNQLFNGDLGVLWPDDDGRMVAWFVAVEGEGHAPRSFSRLRLPTHEIAWAMTVHKSQGSEFDEVLVFLPESGSRLLTLPLLYTAVTRARRRAQVVGTTATIQAALQHETDRSTGLQDRLREAFDAGQKSGPGPDAVVD